MQFEQSVGCSNEVEKYLAKNCDGRKDVNSEILEWWRDNCSRYQVLSKVTKDVLAVPVSTIALSQHLALEATSLIHFEVHYLLSWFKTLYVHKIGFKP